MAEKITMSIKVHVTEREFNDLSRACAATDRSASEYIRVHLLRPHLYGIVRPKTEEGEWSMSATAPL